MTGARRARLLVEPPVGSLRELHARVTAGEAGPGGSAHSAPPFRLGDTVIVPHALWRAAPTAEQESAEHALRLRGMTLRAGYVDQVVVERAPGAVPG